MKKAKVPNLVILGILTVITVVSWIIFGILRVLTKPKPLNISKEILEPVSPTLDSESLNILDQRLFFSDAQIGETILTTPPPEESPTPSPQPQKEQSATQSAESKEATQSAGLGQ